MSQKTVESRGNLPDEVDTVIIGGGIAGVSSALYLARKGLRVLLCEKGRIAGEQSSRNWGWVRVQGRDPREVPIAVHAMGLWQALADELGAETLGFVRGGVAYITDDHSALSGYEQWIKRTAPDRPDGGDSRLLDAADVRALLKTNDDRWQGGMITPSDARAEPSLATAAFARAAVASGAVIETGCAVRGLETSGGRVSGVVTERGAVKASSVILAGGAWSGLFCRSLGLRLPQLKVLATACRTKPAPLVTDTSVYAPGAAFRRRQDGGYTLAAGNSEVFPLVPDGFRFLRDFWPLVRSEVMLGAIRPRLSGQFFTELSYERRWAMDAASPFERCRVLDPKPEMQHVQRALKTASGFSSAFGQLELAEAWAGMIDVLPDVLPVIGPVDEIPGFHLATGFSGHGFGLGPAVGHVMADVITGNKPAVSLDAFRFSRFSDGTDLQAHVHL
ncbi:NAD(P)/FAD-dependent oxidoreductase [Coralliovum pocilloporae]|uniref:NAD(P)/FAD-dependent oxidoreductase n=1 Tax=Coralliovum pocilloporae TaxID=3066369 RepID=UPI003306C9F3